MQVFFPSFTFNTVKKAKEYRTLCVSALKQKKSLSGNKKNNQLTIDIEFPRKAMDQEMVKKQSNKIKTEKNNKTIISTPETPRKSLSNRKLTKSKKTQEIFIPEQLETKPLRNLARLKTPTKSLASSRKKERKIDTTFFGSFLIAKKANPTQKRPQSQTQTRKTYRYLPKNVKQHKKNPSQTRYELNQTDYRPWSPKKGDSLMDVIDI